MLFSAIDDVKVLNELTRQGFGELVIQKGAGDYQIQNITKCSTSIEIKYCGFNLNVNVN